MSEESTTDLHPARRSRRETAKQIGIPAATATLIVGLVGGVVRSRDVDRIETRQDKMDEQTRSNSSHIIELKADSRNQSEKLEMIYRGVELLNTKVDTMRDRLPR
jgi:Na+/glutamate symporter